MPKVSVNIANAKSTTRHNDRSLYHKEKSPSEFERRDHGENIHWDCYNCGSSFKAEELFYKDTFSDTLKEQNKHAIKTGHAERKMTMKQYHKKHMPKEMIISLGNKDDLPMKNGKVDEDWIKEATLQAQYTLEQCGLSVISWDIHLDEATPHAHIRFTGVTDGKINMRKTLSDHGVKTPLQTALDENGITLDENADLLDPKHIGMYKRIAPDLYKTNSKGETIFRASSNSCLNTLTNKMLREPLEQLARDRGYEVDTTRTKRQNLNKAQYQAMQEDKKMSATLDKQMGEIEQHKKLSYRQMNKAIDEAWNSFNDEDMTMIDPITKKEVTPEEFIKTFKGLIQNANYRQSKKDKQLEAVNKFQKELTEINKEYSRPSATVERLTHVQDTFNKEEERREKEEEAMRRQQEAERKKAEAEARRKAEEEARKREVQERANREAERKRREEIQKRRNKSYSRGGR